MFFNHEAGRGGLVDLMFTDRYLNAAQTVAPHLLRYAAVAAVVGSGGSGRRRRSAAMRDLARVVEQESYEYRDPVTEFVRRLYVDHDFEGAREALAEAGPVMEGDFFVAALAREFADAARNLVFENYCKVHERIDLASLSSKLRLENGGGGGGGGGEGEGEAAASSSSPSSSTGNDAADAAEAYIVDLIRNARLRAQVDSRAKAVVIASAFPSVQDQLIETVRGLTQRTQVLANAVGAGAPTR